MKRAIHFKCRNSNYPHTQIQRLNVKDEQVDWSVEVKNYKPPEYNAPQLLNKPWADPHISMFFFFNLWHSYLYISFIKSQVNNFNICFIYYCI